ncbi:hypothetical protein KW797_02185 [Candidatus Parcubacteria bacterium]|nr:hypothetical protein [Candidatus Parcubacteria bacterium]
MAPPTLAIRGVLANLEAGLALRFQFNPTSIDITKDVNYSVTEIPGWDHPDIVFESGGAQRIKFDLLFDRTPVSSSLRDLSGGSGAFTTIGAAPLVGTEAVRAVIESFLYPQVDVLKFVGGTERYKPPPDGLLVLGTRFWKVKVEGGQALREVLFDTLLTPMRLFTNMSFLVIEEGAANKFAVGRRNILAKAESVIAAADLTVETFNRFA